MGVQLSPPVNTPVPLWARGSPAISRFFLGAALIGAAITKAYQIATTPSLATTIWSSQWFILVQAEYEFLLGLWLLSGLYPRQSALTALVTFAVFLTIVLEKVLSGESSCGCFGTIVINPSYALIFDLMAVAILSWLIWIKSQGEKSARHPARFAWLGARRFSLD